MLIQGRDKPRPDSQAAECFQEPGGDYRYRVEFLLSPEVFHLEHVMALLLGLLHICLILLLQVICTLKPGQKTGLT